MTKRPIVTVAWAGTGALSAGAILLWALSGDSMSAAAEGAPLTIGAVLLEPPLLTEVVLVVLAGVDEEAALLPFSVN